MKLIVTSGPHIQSKTSTQSLMRNVIIALLPALAMSVVNYGIRSLILTAVTVACCVFWEYAYEKVLKMPITTADLSAVVTGMLLAFNLPASFPFWMTIVGSFFAIVIAKMLFGGLGLNFVNPALIGRLVMFSGYATQMTNWTYPGVDTAAGATPLTRYANGAGATPDLMDMLLGRTGGTLGETCAIALLIGFVWLVATKTIEITIPVVYVGGVAVLALLGGVDPVVYVLGGGLLLGAIFMATDYVTSPYTTKGKIVYALGLAVITFMIRRFGSMAEGVSFAIILMNLLVPYINRGFRYMPLGVTKEKKAKEAK